MTILDTFFILFESDASKLDKGLAETDKKAGDLTHKIGGADVAAGKLGSSMLASLATIGGAAVAALSISAMSQALFEAVGQADKLNESVARLGLNIETVSAWGDLVKKNGGSVEGFVGSIEGLNTMLQQMEVTGRSRAAPFLKELGIDLDLAANKGKTATDFLLPIADAFEGMDRQKSVAIGKRLGFDQATIMALQGGRREVEALLAREKELGVITAHQGEIADKFGDSLDDLKHSFRSIWLNISEYVLPPITWMIEKFTQATTFLRKHERFAQGLMIALGAAIMTFLVPAAIKGAVAVWAMIAPFALIAAAVIAAGLAFALLYDDVMTFLEGGDSLIGRIANRWPIVGDLVRMIAGQFVYLWDIVKALAEFLFTVWDNPGEAFARFSEKMNAAFYKMLDTFPLLKKAIGAIELAFKAVGDTTMMVWNKIIAVIEATIKTILKAVNAVGDAYSKAKGLVGVGDDESLFNPVATGLALGKKLVAQVTDTPLASQTSNSINTRAVNKNSSVTIGKVEVTTQATDAQGISKVLGDSLQAQMRQTVANFDDGVLN